MTARAFSLGLRHLTPAMPLSYVTWRYGVCLVTAFAFSVVSAWAQTAAGRHPSAIETLVIWLPFIIHGFVLNLLMSVAAMALATVLGIGLGLMQISLRWPVRLPSRFVTRLLRNSPWLVILFGIMYMLPAEVRLVAALCSPSRRGSGSRPKGSPSLARRRCAGSSCRNVFAAPSRPG